MHRPDGLEEKISELVEMAFLCGRFASRKEEAKREHEQVERQVHVLHRRLLDLLATEEHPGDNGRGTTDSATPSPLEELEAPPPGKVMSEAEIRAAALRRADVRTDARLRARLGGAGPTSVPG